MHHIVLSSKINPSLIMNYHIPQLALMTCVFVTAIEQIGLRCAQLATDIFVAHGLDALT